jgi:hypothetical protein
MRCATAQTQRTDERDGMAWQGCALYVRVYMVQALGQAACIIHAWRKSTYALAGILIRNCETD